MVFEDMVVMFTRDNVTYEVTSKGLRSAFHEVGLGQTFEQRQHVTLEISGYVEPEESVSIDLDALDAAEGYTPDQMGMAVLAPRTILRVRGIGLIEHHLAGEVFKTPAGSLIPKSVVTEHQKFAVEQRLIDELEEQEERLRVQARDIRRAWATADDLERSHEKLKVRLHAETTRRVRAEEELRALKHRPSFVGRLVRSGIRSIIGMLSP